MDQLDDLLPIDILAYVTEKLETEFHECGNNVDAQKRAIDGFLVSWKADAALSSVKKLPIQFEEDLTWFNVQSPISIEKLKGHMVVLDFFTYCCINCMHILPELHALEERFPIEKGLVVVGVHSPKFANEKDSSNVLSAIQRYGVTHPVVNDPNSSLWRSIGIRCWPSLMVLSPQGEPILLLMGEGHAKFLECFIERGLQYFSRMDEITKLKEPILSTKDLLPASNLRFPAKIAIHESGDFVQFAVADAGNNRILVFDIDGNVKYKIGGCATGFVDGNLQSARFNSPQGVDFLDADTLVVADTENHALRQINLHTGVVETLAGTGQQGHDRVGGALGHSQILSSPWDVAVFRTADMDMSFHIDHENIPKKPVILISMSGTHQIWGYFPEGSIWWKFRKVEPRICVSLVGNGLEENRNNSYPQNAAFAQPSGIALTFNFMFIADSESSSIRKVSMVDGKVMPVVGGDRNPQNLFAFGDIDGKQYDAKLQHPLGIAYDKLTEQIYLTDTYNHKIKTIDIFTNTVKTLKITKDGNPYPFKEPAGLCFDALGTTLIVADTNNHCLVKVNMENLTAERFDLVFKANEATISETDASGNKGMQFYKQLCCGIFAGLKLNIAIKLDEGINFTENAPQKWQLNLDNSNYDAKYLTGKVADDGTLSIQLQRNISKQVPAEHIKLNLSLSLCDERSCLIKRFTINLTNKDAISESDKKNVAIQVENVLVRVSQTSINIT